MTIMVDGRGNRYYPKKTDSERIEELEQKVCELEKRIIELEKRKIQG